MARARDDIPGVIFPPPLIVLGFLVAGLIIDRHFRFIYLARDWRDAAASALIAAGLVLGFIGYRALRRAATQVSPYRPATALVTEGVYAVTRNPLYLALASIYAGIAIAANGLATLALMVPLMLVMRYGVIAREERYLARKFGVAYLDYCTRVRRWL